MVNVWSGEPKQLDNKNEVFQICHCLASAAKYWFYLKCQIKSKNKLCPGGFIFEKEKVQSTVLFLTWHFPPTSYNFCFNLLAKFGFTVLIRWLNFKWKFKSIWLIFSGKDIVWMEDPSAPLDSVMLCGVINFEFLQGQGPETGIINFQVVCHKMTGKVGQIIYL